MAARRHAAHLPAASIDALREDRQFIGALARGVQILSCFREDTPWLGNQEIAKRCGLPRSTVSRFTYTLTKIDCLELDTRSGKYRLGSRVLSLGHTMLAGFDVATRLLPHMQRLAETTDALVTLSTCVDSSMVCIAAARSAACLAPPIEPGTHLSVATTALGRAYLASASRSERDRLLKHLARAKASSWQALEKDLEACFREYARHGYCTTIDGWRKGYNGVAVPLYLKNYGRRVVLSCGGPAFQLPRDAITRQVGPAMLRVAGEIEVSFEKLLA